MPEIIRLDPEQKNSPNKAKIEETLKKRVATATLFSFIMIMPQAARLASRLCI